MTFRPFSRQNSSTSAPGSACAECRIRRQATRRQLNVDSQTDTITNFIITLPRKIEARHGDQP
jgi:hypothetical protein